MAPAERQAIAPTASYFHQQSAKRGLAARPPPGLESVVPVPPPPLPFVATLVDPKFDRKGLGDGASSCSTDVCEEAPAYVHDSNLQREMRDVGTVSDHHGALKSDADAAFVSSRDGALKSENRGVPSMGSAGHHLGLCKPCDFFHRSSNGCQAGSACTYCHLCGPDEMKRRKLLKKQMIRGIKSWQVSVAAQAQSKLW